MSVQAVFYVPPFQFSIALTHQLLLRKILTKKKHEIQFLIGGSWLRFRIDEFALVIDLDCNAPMSADKLKENSASDRLLNEYINLAVVVKSKKLEETLLIANT